MGKMVGLLAALIKLWFPKLRFHVCRSHLSVPHESVRLESKVRCEHRVQNASCAISDAVSQASVSDPGAACLLSASVGLCSAIMVLASRVKSQTFQSP